MIKNYKLRGSIMPRFRKVTIPEIDYEDEQRKVIGKFKVSITPVGFRKRLSIYHHEISQYFAGGAPRFRVNIKHDGSDKPFNISLWQVKPEQITGFSEYGVLDKKYSKIVEMPYIHSAGEYSYTVRVYSGLDKPEIETEIINFRAWNFDSIIVYVVSGIFTAAIGAIGYIIGKLF